MLCDSLCLSHLNFCSNVYGPAMDTFNSNRIQKLQNCCLRFIYGIRRRQGISHKLKEAGWLNMYSRRCLHEGVFFYKILKFKKPSYLIGKISLRTNVHSRSLRTRILLTIPKHHKQLYKKSFSYRIAFVVNKYKIFDFSNSCSTFRKKLKINFLKK